MIPPASMIQEDTMGKENEREHREPKSPTSISQQESKVWNTSHNNISHSKPTEMYV